MLNFQQITQHKLETDPYGWAAVGNLFSGADAESLATTYPSDHFKTVAGYDGAKDYEYEARELIGMGADGISHPEELSDSWLCLADDLLSPEYRTAMSSLSGCDLADSP